jgi:hypothetical protein
MWGIYDTDALFWVVIAVIAAVAVIKVWADSAKQVLDERVCS